MMKNEKENNHFNLYQQITDSIIEALEKGVGPWIRPWNDSGAQFSQPKNGATGRAYRGINILLLNLIAFKKGFTDPRWVTFSDVQRLGGHINKGEQHTKIVFWKFLEIENQKEEPAEDKSAEDNKKVVPLLRYYRVFNVQQCSNLKIKKLPEPDLGTVRGEEIAQAEKILTLPVLRHGGNRAFYDATCDCIQIPPRETFEDLNHYYVTGFHEVVHWTGHPSRLNRSFGKRYGDSVYAFEELIAEIGSAFLGGQVGLACKEMRHPEYIKVWIDTLKMDNRAVFQACHAAQKAADYVLEKSKPGLEADIAQDEQAVAAV